WMQADAPYGHDLAGATLGLIGFGAIGTAVARRAQASGMRVVYHTRTPRDDDEKTGGEYRSFEDLLSEADCVVALVPLTPQTRGMFDDAAFARMKPSATFVNAARGAVCDTGALLRALEQKKIAGAALDVTDPEPLPPDHPLYAREDVVIVPHVGSATDETRTRMAMLAAENLIAFVEGRPLPTPVAV
ncbi:MAG TPA: NAD(P)-dependent oxidoreductase, partial [Candidatus Elarobacter sp.]|nr:NAD(P)-dependent oxidoreductase [Candidatus Elarobacter sp.]